MNPMLAMDANSSDGSMRRAMLLVAAFAMLWAVVEAVAQPLLRRYSPYQVVWSRYVVHVGLMVVVWGWREPASLWRTKRPVFQLARSLLMLAMPAAWVIGMQKGVDSETLLAEFWSSPLLVLALATIFLRTRVPSGAWIAGTAAFVGALVLHPPAPLAAAHLYLFPLAMAASFSAYVVMTWSLRTESPRANLFYTAVGVMAVLTPAMPAVWTAPAAPDLLVMGSIGVLGFFTLWALDLAAHLAPIAVPAPFMYLQLVLFSVFAFVTGPGLPGSPRRAAVGLLLIVGACVYLWAFESRPHLPDDASP